MDTRAIRGVDLPPRGQGRTYPVVWPKLGRSLDVVVLDEWIYGMWTHYGTDPGDQVARSRLCTREDCCERCGKQMERWQGYAGVLQMSGPAQLAILLVSAEAARSLSLHAVQYQGLRGLRVILERAGGRSNGQVKVTLSQCAAPKRLPAAFDIGLSLRLLYGVKQLPGATVQAGDIPGDVP